MADKVTLKLVTPLREVVAGQADMVVLPAFEGEMGVLPGHDYVFAALSVGDLRMVNGNETRHFFVANGFAEIGDDVVRVLAEVCEPREQIDLDRAEAARKRAETHLTQSVSDANIDVSRAQAALNRALRRQSIASGR